MKTRFLPVLLLTLTLTPAAWALDLGGLGKALGNADKLKKGLDTAKDASKVVKLNVNTVRAAVQVHNGASGG